MILSEILVPLLNANEPEARVVDVHVHDRQPVKKGDLLFTLETTKAATDVESPAAGFVRLLSAEGETLPVGRQLAVITGTADEVVETRLPVETTPAPDGDLRITKPARELAQVLGVELSSLPTSSLVTEAVVRQFAGELKLELPPVPSDLSRLVVYGGGGHAKTVIEIAQAVGKYSIVGIVDDGIPAGTRVLGIPVLGGRAVLPALRKAGVQLAANGVGGILDIQVRVKLFELLEAQGFELPSLVHPSATVEPSATIGKGTQVFANAYVGSEARLHPRCMVNTNAVVSHDCEVGEYTHIAPGALLAGHVHVGARTLVGMGVTTAIGVHIGSGVRVGNAAILLADVPDRTIIQAGRFWTGKTENSAT